MEGSEPRAEIPQTGNEEPISLSHRRPAVGEDDCSRNQGIDRGSIINVSLPTNRQLARAVAVVKAVSARAAVGLSKSDFDRVALWAVRCLPDGGVFAS